MNLTESKIVVTDEDRRLVEELTANKSDPTDPLPISDYQRAELALRALAQCQSAWEVGEALDPKHFEDNGHRAVFKVLRDSRRRFGGFSYESCLELLKEEVPDPAKVLEYTGTLTAVFNNPVTQPDTEAVKSLLSGSPKVF